MSRYGETEGRVSQGMRLPQSKTFHRNQFTDGPSPDGAGDGRVRRRRAVRPEPARKGGAFGATSTGELWERSRSKQEGSGHTGLTDGSRFRGFSIFPTKEGDINE